MFKNKKINIFILLYLIKFNHVYASNSSKVEIGFILFMLIMVIFNFMSTKNDKKNRMLLSNIFEFDSGDIEINYFIKNIIRLIFIVAYYFFVIPIFIDFFIATIQLIIKNIKIKKVK